MTPQELKNSILQLAIQGKLVEQRPEEGTAEELYRQIQQEKQAHIKAGKIKKEKPLPEITEDEIPFDIPESWKWVHLCQIAESSLGKTLDKAKNTGELCPYLCSINVYWTGIDLETVKQARFTEEDKTKYRLQFGDLLICEGGDIGRSAIWESDKEMYYQNALHRVRFYGSVIPVYFRYLLECYKGLGILDEYSKGMTIKHLVQNSLYSMWLPLPPLAEQKRIVARIEELLPLIDRYEKAWNRLEDFNKRFPADMQKSLLQLAIQGKLVEQRPEEGNVQEEITSMHIKREQLFAEKRLRKEGKINKTSNVEIDIPAHWRLIPLRELICKKVDNRGKTPTHSEIKTAQFFIDLLEINSIVPGASINHDNVEKFIDLQTYNNLRGFVEKDDILIATVGSIGKFALMDNTKSAIAQNIIAIKCFEEVDQKYIFYLLQTPYFYQSMGCITMEAVQASIKVPDLMNVNVPLPPLAEQKRIVAKLEELLPLCQRLAL